MGVCSRKWFMVIVFVVVGFVQVLMMMHPYLMVCKRILAVD